jgi:hypothetical protein
MLEGGFDEQERFVHLPFLDVSQLTQYFRHGTIAPQRTARAKHAGWVHRQTDDRRLRKDAEAPERDF